MRLTHTQSKSSTSCPGANPKRNIFIDISDWNLVKVCESRPAWMFIRQSQYSWVPAQSISNTLRTHHRVITSWCKWLYQWQWSTKMADICRDWLTDWPKHGLMLCCDWFSTNNPTVLCCTPKNRSSRIQLVHRLCWQVSVVRENVYLHWWPVRYPEEYIHRLSIQTCSTALSSCVFSSVFRHLSSVTCSRRLCPIFADNASASSFCQRINN